MSDLIVYGFPRSTFVNIVRLVLTHKEVTYTFHDLEPEMGKPSHLALHPFNRVPILRHGDFTVYETSAIVSYLEESFPKPALQPKSVRDRARVNQWISAVNSYYYPYMIYHVSHERNVFTRAWNSVRRECCGACPAEDRGGTESSGARAGARQRLSSRFRTHACGLLPAAKHLFI
jgi:glutathione S-transferase